MPFATDLFKFTSSEGLCQKENYKYSKYFPPLPKITINIILRGVFACV